MFKQQSGKHEKFEWSYPIGWYPPLYSKNNLDATKQSTLFFLVLGNLLLRFLFYPICFGFSALMSAAAIVVAAFLNIGFLLGGSFSASWSEATGRLNQIAMTRFLWLIVDPFAFVVNQGHLIIGLFSSPHAIAILHDLKEMIDTVHQAKVSPFQLDWNKAHLERIRRFTTYLREIGLLSAAVNLAALGAETFLAVGAGIRMMLRGGTNDFHEYGANPKTLTEAQLKMPPVLLLHGDEHDPTAFEPLLADLRNRGYQGPVFTAYSPPDIDGIPMMFLTEPKRQKPIKEKIREIDALYQQYGMMPREGEVHIRCVIVGHSSGADSAVLMEDNPSETTENIMILLGACKHSKRPQRELYTYVNASPDLILNLLPEDKDNIEPNGEVLIFSTGHLGLLSNPNTFDLCYEKLTSKQTQRFFSSGLNVRESRYTPYEARLTIV